MKVWLNSEIHGVLTFIATYWFLNVIWVFIEKWLHGETRPSTEDSIMLFIFSLIYTIEVMGKG